MFLLRRLGNEDFSPRGLLPTKKKLHSCAHVKYFWCLSFVYIDLLNPRTVIFFEVVKKSKDTIWISWSALLGALRHNCFWILSNCALPASTVSLHLHNAVLLPLSAGTSWGGLLHGRGIERSVMPVWPFSILRVPVCVLFELCSFMFGHAHRCVVCQCLWFLLQRAVTNTW